MYLSTVKSYCAVSSMSNTSSRLWATQILIVTLYEGQMQYVLHHRMGRGRGIVFSSGSKHYNNHTSLTPYASSWRWWMCFEWGMKNEHTLRFTIWQISRISHVFLLERISNSTCDKIKKIRALHFSVLKWNEKIETYQMEESSQQQVLSEEMAEYNSNSVKIGSKVNNIKATKVRR